MPDYRAIARQKARRYGLDPNIFVRQIGAESGWNPNARSPAGATGIAQIMPATARSWGVNPNNPEQALDAAAKNMASYVRKYGSYENALRAYNAGPAAIQRSRQFSETNNYVRRILGGRDPGRLNSRQAEPSSRESDPEQASVQTGTRTITDEAGFEDARKKYALGRLLSKSNPSNTLVRLGILPTEAPTADAFKSTTPTFTDPIANIRSPATRQSSGSGGAAAALGWAEQKIGNQETGPNTGGLASFANRRFGMSGQPWCAMFTSLAVTKGGAPKQARTASVAAVLAKAQAGQGYVRGFIPVSRARPGDLITFGTRHIGMVESVSGNRVRMIAGNDSDQVQRRTVKVAGDTKIVRPAYRR